MVERGNLVRFQTEIKNFKNASKNLLVNLNSLTQFNNTTFTNFLNTIGGFTRLLNNMVKLPEVPLGGELDRATLSNLSALWKITQDYKKFPIPSLPSEFGKEISQEYRNFIGNFDRLIQRFLVDLPLTQGKFDWNKFDQVADQKITLLNNMANLINKYANTLGTSVREALQTLNEVDQALGESVTTTTANKYRNILIKCAKFEKAVENIKT